MARPSSPPKPQSIIHHLGRLGSKVARPLLSQKKRTKSSESLSLKSGTETTGPPSLRSSKSLPFFATADTHLRLNDSVALTVANTSDTSSKDSYSIGLDIDSISDCCSDAGKDIVHGCLSEFEEDGFETMDQNEFLFECFISNKLSDKLSFVHFFNEDSKISNEIEKSISCVVTGENANCQCIRVNARLAPLFTKKLGIDPEQPTVVAIRNGNVIDRVSDFSSGVREEVEHWLEANDFLNHSELLFSLSNLSTE